MSYLFVFMIAGILSICFPLELGVTIGFSPTTYTVSEDVASVSVAVSLRNGILARDVVVTLQTLDGTAIGGLLFRYGVHGACKVIYNLYPQISRWDGFSKYIDRPDIEYFHNNSNCDGTHC